MRRFALIDGQLLGVLGISLSVSMFSSVSSAVSMQDAAQVKQGQQLFNDQKCQICHAIAGKGNKQNPLDGVGTKLSAEDIRQWITHPDVMAAKVKSTKKPPMPKTYAKLPAADLDALVAYLQSLK
jgi:mono/diheme cytochrome c family protein